MKLALRYRWDRKIRAAVMALMGRLTRRSPEQTVDLKSETIEKILLVRGIFRLGDAILTTPAILLLRDNFPGAGTPHRSKAMSRTLLMSALYEIPAARAALTPRASACKRLVIEAGRASLTGSARRHLPGRLRQQPS